jgi:hypothetical protein
MEMTAGEIEADLAQVIERLADQVTRRQPSS